MAPTVDLSSIFKAYDIRGESPDPLDADVARRIGAAFATFADADRIVVGRDCRPSSPALSAGFAAGAAESGASVWDAGEITSDMVYYIAGAESVAGAMITASHNPPQYNGIKLTLAGARPVGVDSGLEQVRRMAEEGLTPAERPGTIEVRDFRGSYVDHLLGLIEPGALKPLRVAVDGGNGMAGVVIESIFAKIAPSIHGIYLDPDGTFPNHPADPLRPENLEDLAAHMSQIDADVGVAFDGDADRAVFVDDKLQTLSGSTTTAMLGAWFLRREPGAAVVHNLITSRAVPETILRLGGRPVKTRVGHSYIKGVMAETDAVFGGEHSGHYYFRDNFRADSGMAAMLVLLQALSEDGRPLSEMRTEYEPYAQSGEINMTVLDQAKMMQQVANAFPGADTDWIDGVTLSWPDRWFNLRPSNTEPLLRLNVEAPDSAQVAKLVAEVTKVLEEG